MSEVKSKRERWSPDFYEGAVGGYEREISEAKIAVNSADRGKQMAMMARDYRSLWEEHAAILAEHREMREALVIYVQGHPFQAAIAEDRAKELLARISAREEGENNGR